MLKCYWYSKVQKIRIKTLNDWIILSIKMTINPIKFALGAYIFTIFIIYGQYTH